LINTKGSIGKQIVFISGLNIDISPDQTEVFPSTTFVPWAAFIQEKNGHYYILEQKDILNRLLEQSEDNPDEVDLEIAIQKMKETRNIRGKIFD